MTIEEDLVKGMLKFRRVLNSTNSGGPYCASLVAIVQNIR